MSALYAIVLILCAGTPIGVAVLGLAVALHVFLHGTGIELDAARLISLGIVLSSVPLAAMLSGIFFDSFLGTSSERGIFSLLLPVLACALMLTGTGWVDYLGVAIVESGKPTLVRQAALAVSAMSAASFCAALSAFVILSATIVFELPIRWLQGAAKARIDLALAAARPLLIVLGLSLSFNLLLGLCGHELWPTTIAARILGV